MFFQLDLMCCFFPVTWDLLVLLETMCTLTGPPPGANMGMGMMNPDMMGMMQQHDLGMGFDLSQGGPCSKACNHCIFTVLSAKRCEEVCDRL